MQTHDILEPRRALHGLVSDDNAVHNDAVDNFLVAVAFGRDAAVGEDHCPLVRSILGCAAR
jgi:hypothetical protein